MYDASTRILAEFGGIWDLSRHLSLNLNGSRNRDISFFSSSSFVGGIRLLLGVVGLFAASDMVSAITSSLSTYSSRREALSEVG